MCRDFWAFGHCRVDKTHFSMKYELKTFMEAEFARRNLFKQVAKDAAKEWVLGYGREETYAQITTANEE